MRYLASWLALFVACAPGAGESDATVDDGARRAEAGFLPAEAETTYLDRYDFDGGGRSFDLPGRLDEVSGLAVSADGRLFAHDDERGRIHEIDPATGEVGMRIDLGSGEVRDDLEGMAIVSDRFFLVSSSGFLYEFREGGDEEDVGYHVSDTGLGDGCEIEGLDYDPDAGALLFACKQTEGYRDFVVIHRIPLGDEGDGPPPWSEPPTGMGKTLPPILIPRADLPAHGLDADFQASAVVVTPAGTLILASAATEALVEVDGAGRVLGSVPLFSERHAQAEGLELGPDGSLYIADEGNEDDARLTRYEPRGSDDR